MAPDLNIKDTNYHRPLDAKNCAWIDGAITETFIPEEYLFLLSTACISMFKWDHKDNYIMIIHCYRAYWSLFPKF